MWSSCPLVSHYGPIRSWRHYISDIFYAILIFVWYLKASWDLLQSYEDSSLNWEEDLWFNSWYESYTWGIFCWIFWCYLGNSLQGYLFRDWLCFHMRVCLHQNTFLWCSFISKWWPSRGLSTCSLSTTHWCTDAWSCHRQHFHQKVVLLAHSSEEEELLKTFFIIFVMSIF